MATFDYEILFGDSYPDTVFTTSVDAGGLDQNGVRVAKRGNPLTGPFYVEGAEAGDVLAVTLLQVTLNRNFATTLNALIPKVLPAAAKKDLAQGEAGKMAA